MNHDYLRRKTQCSIHTDECPTTSKELFEELCARVADSLEKEAYSRGNFRPRNEKGLLSSWARRLLMENWNMYLYPFLKDLLNSMVQAEMEGLPPLDESGAAWSAEKIYYLVPFNLRANYTHYQLTLPSFPIRDRIGQLQLERLTQNTSQVESTLAHIKEEIAEEDSDDQPLAHSSEVTPGVTAGTFVPNSDTPGPVEKNVNSNNNTDAPQYIMVGFIKDEEDEQGRIITKVNGKRIDPPQTDLDDYARSAALEPENSCDSVHTDSSGSISPSSTTSCDTKVSGEMDTSSDDGSVFTPSDDPVPITTSVPPSGIKNTVDEKKPLADVVVKPSESLHTPSPLTDTKIKVDPPSSSDVCISSPTTLDDVDSLNDTNDDSWLASPPVTSLSAAESGDASLAAESKPQLHHSISGSSLTATCTYSSSSVSPPSNLDSSDGELLFSHPYPYNHGLFKHENVSPTKPPSPTPNMCSTTTSVVASTSCPSESTDVSAAAATTHPSEARDADSSVAVSTPCPTESKDSVPRTVMDSSPDVDASSQFKSTMEFCLEKVLESPSSPPRTPRQPFRKPSTPNIRPATPVDLNSTLPMDTLLDDISFSSNRERVLAGLLPPSPLTHSFDFGGDVLEPEIETAACNDVSSGIVDSPFHSCFTSSPEDLIGVLHEKMLEETRSFDESSDRNGGDLLNESIQLLLLGAERRREEEDLFDDVLGYVEKKPKNYGCKKLNKRARKGSDSDDDRPLATIKRRQSTSETSVHMHYRRLGTIEEQQREPDPLPDKPALNIPRRFDPPIPIPTPTRNDNDAPQQIRTTTAPVPTLVTGIDIGTNPNNRRGSTSSAGRTRSFRK